MSVRYLLTRQKDRGRAVDESLTNDVCIDIRSIKLCHPNMCPSYCEKSTNLASRPAGMLRPYIQQQRRPPTGKERKAARKTHLHACAQVSKDIPRGQDWYPKARRKLCFPKRGEELRKRESSRKGKCPVKFVSGIGLVSEQDLPRLP